MRVLVIFVLLLILGVNPTYGEEKSCGELVLAVSSDLKKHFEALKVYKKVEDRTESYAKLKKKNSNLAELKKSIFISKGMLSEYNVSRDLMSWEQRFSFDLQEFLVKDIEDKSSEVVLLCMGRMRLSDGVRHFMLSVTKDEEGDRYWTASLL